MFCPKCGTENLDNAHFCKKCGYEFPEKGLSLVTIQEKLIPFGNKLLGFLSSLGPKIGVKISLFYQKKIKITQKPFLIILLMLILLGGGLLIYQQSISPKKASEVSSLESLALKFENWEETFNFLREAPRGTSDSWIKEGLELANLYKKSVNSYFNFAKKLNPKHPDKFKELLERDKILRKIATRYENRYYFFNLAKTKGGEKFRKIFSESMILLNKIKIIEEDTTVIEAEYQERENNKIPIGYSFIAVEGKNGKRQNVTVIVEGRKKGPVTIITKEPKDGIKIIGTGSFESIVKIVSIELDEIIKFFQNQNLTAATILPFLDEKNKEKAISWENEYKSTVFNWRRFDEYEIIPGQITFEKDTYYRSESQTIPIKILLPVKVKYYQAGYREEDIPKIPFYYSKEKDEWISTNETIEKLFRIINNQIIPASVSSDTFTFPKTKECDLYDRKVKIETIGISRKNVLQGNFSQSITGLILAIGDYRSELIEIGKTLPSELISNVNNAKKTIWIGKTFKYQYSGWGSKIYCEASPNITFTFFSE